MPIDTGWFKGRGTRRGTRFHGIQQNDVVQVGHIADSEWKSGDVKRKIIEKNVEMRDASQRRKV